MGSARDKHGARERFAKEIVMREEWRMAVCRQCNLDQPPYIYIIYIYIHINIVTTCRKPSLMVGFRML